MDKHTFLSAYRPEVEKIELNGQTLYLREPTVGDNNFLLFEQQAYALRRAKELGYEVDTSDPERLKRLLDTVGDPYVLARGAASRLCDAQGNLLFDPKNEDDLTALNQLGQHFLEVFQSADIKKKA